MQRKAGFGPVPVKNILVIKCYCNVAKIRVVFVAIRPVLSFFSSLAAYEHLTSG